jgi:hypothetical protein
MSTNAKWSRPPLAFTDETKDNIVFQQLDMDFYEGNFNDSFVHSVI